MLFSGLYRMLTEPRMTLEVANCFIDVVSRKPVHLYVDHKGVYWFSESNSPFSFRSYCREAESWLHWDRRRRQASSTLPQGQTFREL